MIVSDCFSESKEANASTTQFQQESPLGQGKHHSHPPPRPPTHKLS